MHNYRGFGEEIVGVPWARWTEEEAGRVRNPAAAFTVEREQMVGTTSPIVEDATRGSASGPGGVVSASSASTKQEDSGPNWLLWGAVAVGAWWLWKKK